MGGLWRGGGGLLQTRERLGLVVAHFGDREEEEGGDGGPLRPSLGIDEGWDPPMTCLKRETHDLRQSMKTVKQVLPKKCWWISRQYCNSRRKERKVG